MKTFSLFFLIIFINLLSLKAEEVPSNHSLLFKVGYGGTYNYKGKDLYSIKDNSRYSIDWVYKDQFSLSVSYDRPFLYDYFNLKEFTIAGKYFPFNWYNQPFIGLSYSSGTYKYGNAEKYPTYTHGDGKHNAFGIVWGLNIRFPKNIFIVFEANNIFRGFTGVFEATHTLYVNGMLGYKLNIGQKKK